MSRTTIEWATDSWNPIAFFAPDENGVEKRGWMCTKPSEGCAHCYAEAMNRYRGNGLKYTVGSLDRGRFDLVNLDEPIGWRKPRQVFVCSMTDLFHEALYDAMIDEVIYQIAVCQAAGREHVFIALTKRAARMRAYFSNPSLRNRIPVNIEWPLKNLWLGVTAENQKRFDERLPDLLETPAAHRWISAEPLLGPIETPLPCEGSVFWNGIDLIVAGGESGAGARPMHPAWPRLLRDMCADAGTGFHFKQWGAWAPSVHRSMADNRVCLRTDGHQQWAPSFPGFVVMQRAGKEANGRQLDGRTWDDRPGLGGLIRPTGTT